MSWLGTMIGWPLAGCRMLLVDIIKHARLELRFERQRHVHGHLVAVEVGVERRADERMQLDRLALDQHRLEGLNAESMQGRRAVQHDRMLADHLVEDVPNFRLLLFDQLLRLLDGRATGPWRQGANR